MDEFKEWRRRQLRRYELEDAKAMLVPAIFWLAVWTAVMAVTFSSIKL